MLLFSLRVSYFMHYVPKFISEEIVVTRMESNLPRSLTELMQDIVVYCQ